MTPIAQIQAAAKLVAACLATLLVCGCIVLPTAHQSAGSRTNADRSDFRFVRVGDTSRAEVLLKLGEPDGRDGDKSFVYRSTRTLLIGASEGGGGDLLRGSKFTRLIFDDAGRVASIERESGIAGGY